MTDTRYRNPTRFALEDNSDLEAMRAAVKAEQVAAEMDEGDTSTPTTPQEILADPALLQSPETEEEKVFKKRYADLRRHEQDQKRKYDTEIADLKRQLTDATRQSMRLPAHDEELEAWVKEFPDVARIVETIAIKRANDVLSQADARIKQVEERERQTAKQSAMAQLQARHPDLQQLQNDPAFHQWVKSRSRAFQHSVYESDEWEACADAIDAYKAAHKLQEDASKRSPGRPRKEEALEITQPVSTPTSRPTTNPGRSDGKRVYRASEIARMRPREFEAAEADLEAAKKEGRIINDLSKGAF